MTAPPEPARVLVTRPAGQADGLCEVLQALGYKVTHQPLLELQATEEFTAVQRRQLQELDTYQHVVFVSANAVHFGMDAIESYWPQLPVGLAWYAVGSRTAALLNGFGLEVHSPLQNMSSEGLLAHPMLQNVSGHSVLIIRGVGGRTTLQDELERRGARVQNFECYRRSCPELARGEMASLLDKEQIEVILLSSGEGFTNLLALLSPQETTKFRDISLIVPSARVADVAKQSGFVRVEVAANATDDAMLAALGRHTSRSGE